MIRVGVFGAGGRMGATVCQAVSNDPELELVAAVDPHHAGIELSRVAGLERTQVDPSDVPTEVLVSGDPAVFSEANVDVAVDFTEIGAARANLDWLASEGIHAVVGTTGFTDDDVESLRRRFSRSNCLVAPNFAIGAILMMRFAAAAAPYFDTAEIIELHHDLKVDAPSGTAALTAQRMADASDAWAPDATTDEWAPGVRGGAGAAGIRIHSIRMRGMVAHQEVVMGTTGQTLSIRHDSIDRTSFMPGVLLAVKAISEHPGVTVGLDTFLAL